MKWGGSDNASGHVCVAFHFCISQGLFQCNLGVRLFLLDVKSRVFPRRMYFKGKRGALVLILPPCLTLDVKCVAVAHKGLAAHPRG